MATLIGELRLRVILPVPFVTLIPLPAAIVASEKPVLVPIGICPFAGVPVSPVPPLAVPTVPRLSDTAPLVVVALIGLVAETDVMPLLPPVALIVWFGQDPVIVMFEPWIRPGEAVPVPPFATGIMPVSEMMGETPPEDDSGVVALTALTPLEPPLTPVQYARTMTTPLAPLPPAYEPVPALDAPAPPEPTEYEYVAAGLVIIE